MTKQSIPQRMHEQMHQLPGMPEHSRAESLNQRAGFPNHALKNRPLQSRVAQAHRKHGDPKVLVGWQNAIDRFFSRGHK